MISVWIESRGDTVDATWDIATDLPAFEFSGLYEGIAALHEAAAADILADWAPERRLVAYYPTKGRYEYYKTTCLRL